MKRFTRGISLFLMFILLVGLQGWSSATSPILQVTPESVYPHPYRATWLETVQVHLSWTLFDMHDVKVVVAKSDALTMVDRLSNTVSFVLPKNIWGGPQQFSIMGVHNQTNQILTLAEGTINVLGKSVFNEQNDPNTNNSTINNPTPSIFFVFKPEKKGQLPSLTNTNLELVSQAGISLGGTETSTDQSPCNYKLYEAKSRTVLRGGITSAVLSVGQAMEALEGTRTIVDVAGVLAADPRPGDSLNKPTKLPPSQNVNPVDAKVVVGGGISSSEDTTIAILDSGISKTLANNPAYHILGDSTSFLTGQDSQTYFNGFTDARGNVGHGTAVAALASSISPLSKILSVKVCDSKGKCPFASVIQGICHVVNFAKSHPQTQVILNMSLGADTPSQIIYNILRNAMTTPKYPGGNIKIDQPLIRVVASSGNDWDKRTSNHGDLFHYPAAFAGIKGLSTIRGSNERIPSIKDLISVGAIGFTQMFGFGVANFSNQGDYVSIAAPGFNVRSINPRGEFQLYTGTSFAAPIVAGALALISPSSGTVDAPASGAAIKAKLLKLVKPIYDENIRTDITSRGRDSLSEAIGAGMLDLSSLLPL
jgi:subtilisin